MEAFERKPACRRGRLANGLGRTSNKTRVHEFYDVFVVGGQNAAKENFSPSVRLPAPDQVKDTILIASLFYPSSFNKGEYRIPFLTIYTVILRRIIKRVYISVISWGKPDRATRQALSECQDAFINTLIRFWDFFGSWR